MSLTTLGLNLIYTTPEMIELVKHSWKEFFRSSVWQKSAFVNFLMGLLFLYLALNFAFLGYVAGDILLKIFPGESPITNLNYGLLYYFLIDIFLRFYMQPIPVLSLIPYLHLPVNKKKMIHFTLVKSLANVFNTSIFIMAIPFAIGWIAKYESSSGAWFWIFALFAFNGINNFLSIYLKRVLAEKPQIVLGFGGLIASLIALDYFDIVKIGEFSRLLFDGAIYNAVWLLGPLAIMGLTYLIVYKFYAKNAYLENFEDSKKKNIKSTNISFLNRFEQIGKLIEVELKLIWRNKRSKSVAIVSFLFVFYGFILYPTGGQNAFSLILFGLIITGMFMLNYGQFLISWESGYFDGLLARNVQLSDYISAKFYLFTASVVAAFIFSLIYAYFGWKIVLFNAAVAVFNIGVTSWIVLYTATFNPKKIDLSKSSFMNYQGTGAQQFILMIPVMGLPVFLYGLFYLIVGETAGLISLFVAGGIGILLTKTFNKLLTERLREQRYKIASNFRE